MILQAETLIKYGYLPLDLKPKSHKPILAACDDCGKERETTRNAYRSLCISCANIGRRHTEATKVKIRVGNKGKKRTEEVNALKSAAMKGNSYALGCEYSKETKALMSKNHADFKGKKNPRWLGGISFEPYCIKFDEAYKQLIRNKFDNRCFWCGLTPEENGRALDVHHVNYNKRCRCDETKCICVPLCKSCHSKTNTDRDGWQEKIMKKLELSGILIED
jgi:hypothetical protein